MLTLRVQVPLGVTAAEPDPYFFLENKAVPVNPLSLNG